MIVAMGRDGSGLGARPGRNPAMSAEWNRGVQQLYDAWEHQGHRARRMTAMLHRGDAALARGRLVMAAANRRHAPVSADQVAERTAELVLFRLNNRWLG